MNKIVRFQSFELPELAEEMAMKVQSYLYDVTRDKNELIFSKFDEEAFNLVINLVGLSRQDYCFIDSESVNKEARVATICEFRQARIVLEIEINIPMFVRFPFAARSTNLDREVVHCFRLLVRDVLQPSESTTEVYLEIDSSLSYFATLIKIIARENSYSLPRMGQIPIIDRITSAVCTVNHHNCHKTYTLNVERNGAIESLHFFPREITLERVS